MHQPKAVPKVVVEIVRGRAVEHFRPFEGSAFLIGTAEDCDLVLSAPEFPDVHAYLLRHNEGVSIRYLGAKPALTVNGRLVRSDRLNDGDCIVTGPYEFVVHIEQQAGIGDDAGPRFDRLSTSLALCSATEDAHLAHVEALVLLRDIRVALYSETQHSDVQPRLFDRSRIA